MLRYMSRDQKLEVAFIAVFSAVIVGLLYSLISINGLVLGNDPAVHLVKAKIFLETGQISLGNVGWLPPLFEIMLSMVISIGGITNVNQMILLEKVLAVTIDWLLFFSVYLVASRFFNKKVGAVAAVFLSMCYPIYFLNTWGGYTTALGMAFLFLLLYCSILANKKSGYIAAAFFVSFAIALSHQLTAFIAVCIMFPVMFYMTLKFKRSYLLAFMAAIIGGVVAFFAFYYPAMANYLDVALYHMFLGNKSYVVDIPYTNLTSFLLYYGAIQFFAVGGVGISYYLLKQKKNLVTFLALALCLFIPLFFAESYLLGLYLPFEWFTYYLAPSIAIFGSICIVYLSEKVVGYFKNGSGLRRYRLKIASILLILLIGCPLIGFQIKNVYGEVIEASAFNSRADISTYEAAVWLDQNYPSNTTVVDTLYPGDWLTLFSNKHVISQTYDWEGANSVADSVLNLHYEIKGAQSSVKAFETGNTNEVYVFKDGMWYRVSYSTLTDDSLSFTQKGTKYSFALLEFNRTVTLVNNSSNAKAVHFRYFNEYVELTKIIAIQNDCCSINVSWSITPLNGEITNVDLFLTSHFDLQFNFDKAQVTQYMNWTNPWDMPSKYSTADWAIVDFNTTCLADRYIGLYDTAQQTAFAYNFTDLPCWLSIGALASRQIDAVRYRYDFNQINANQTTTRQHQELTLAKSSYPALEPDDLKGFFSLECAQGNVSAQSYKQYIAENNIGFLFYDKTQTDGHTSQAFGASFLPQIERCSFLELVYTNGRYALFRFLDNYNQTQVWPGSS